MFVDSLKSVLAKFHLLQHHFYQSWSAGTLGVSSLREYACLYYKHVEAFPRYISAMHSVCSDIASRQVLLANLKDEEEGEENHPELWLRFCESLGVKRNEAKGYLLNDATKNLVDGFFSMCRHSYASGLGALFAYEQQVPSVAQSKIEGLRRFYGYDENDPGIKFFKVHIAADEWHSQECANLMNNLTVAEQKIAHSSSVQAAKLLWNFLDGIDCSKASHC